MSSNSLYMGMEKGNDGDGENVGQPPEIRRSQCHNCLSHLDLFHVMLVF